ncbi:MAG: hypothetical protein IPJ00_11255 [Saprospirales bacterium]|nr:hypothetical protein [Saprospirales bacterium]
MMKYLRLLILLLTLPLPVLSQAPAFFGLLEQKLPERPEKEFQFLAYYYNHGMFTNMYPENDFLKGQIIGRLYGQNTTTTSDSLRPFFFEQRLLPFLIYQPKLFDGRAILRASFEIDWTWGDVSTVWAGISVRPFLRIRSISKPRTWSWSSSPPKAGRSTWVFSACTIPPSIPTGASSTS